MATSIGAIGNLVINYGVTGPTGTVIPLMEPTNVEVRSAALIEPAAIGFADSRLFSQGLGSIVLRFTAPLLIGASFATAANLNSFLGLPTSGRTGGLITNVGTTVVNIPTSQINHSFSIAVFDNVSISWGATMGIPKISGDIYLGGTIAAGPASLPALPTSFPTDAAIGATVTASYGATPTSEDSLLGGSMHFSNGVYPNPAGPLTAGAVAPFTGIYLPASYLNRIFGASLTIHQQAGASNIADPTSPASTIAMKVVFKNASGASTLTAAFNSLVPDTSTALSLGVSSFTKSYVSVGSSATSVDSVVLS